MQRRAEVDLNLGVLGRGVLARTIGIEASVKHAQQHLRDVRMLDEGRRDILRFVPSADLAQIAVVGTNGGGLAPVETGGEDQAIEGVVVGVALLHAPERLAHPLVDLGIDKPRRGVGTHADDRHVHRIDAVGAHHVGSLVDDFEAEVVQDGQDARQRQRGAAIEQAELDIVLVGGRTKCQVGLG